jgi:hypothetical protein
MEVDVGGGGVLGALGVQSDRKSDVDTDEKP